MTIGEVAKSVGINVETVRYYERTNLIEQPEKPIEGYRDYSPEIIKRIYFIKKAQELGFSLADIKELLSLKIDDNCKCGKVKDKATSKIGEIESKIKDLKRMKKVLCYWSLLVC